LPQGRLFFFSLRDSKGFRGTENRRFGVKTRMDARLTKTPARNLEKEAREAQKMNNAGEET